MRIPGRFKGKGVRMDLKKWFFAVLCGLLYVGSVQAGEPMVIGMIFDCDGTLIDSEYAHFLSWRSALNGLGFVLTEEEYFPLAGHSGDYVAQRLCEMAQVGSVEAIFQAKRDAYRALYIDEVVPIERTLHLVRQLSEHREQLCIKLAVASAAPKKEILRHLHHLGLSEVFDVVVSGKDDLAHYADPEGVNKPKPYIYLHAAKLLGLEPSRCVAFEDSGPGVLSAVRAGLTTFAVPNAFTKAHDFSRATYVIEPSVEIPLEELFQKIHLRITLSNGI